LAQALAQERAVSLAPRACARAVAPARAPTVSPISSSSSFSSLSPAAGMGGERGSSTRMGFAVPGVSTRIERWFTGKATKGARGENAAWQSTPPRRQKRASGGRLITRNSDSSMEDVYSDELFQTPVHADAAPLLRREASSGRRSGIAAAAQKMLCMGKLPRASTPSPRGSGGGGRTLEEAAALLPAAAAPGSGLGELESELSCHSLSSQSDSQPRRRDDQLGCLSGGVRAFGAAKRRQRVHRASSAVAERHRAKRRGGIARSSAGAGMLSRAESLPPRLCDATSACVGLGDAPLAVALALRDAAADLQHEMLLAELERCRMRLQDRDCRLCDDTTPQREGSVGYGSAPSPKEVPPPGALWTGQESRVAEMLRRRGTCMRAFSADPGPAARKERLSRAMAVADEAACSLTPVYAPSAAFTNGDFTSSDAGGQSTPGRPCCSWSASEPSNRLPRNRRRLKKAQHLVADMLTPRSESVDISPFGFACIRAADARQRHASAPPLRAMTTMEEDEDLERLDDQPLSAVPLQPLNGSKPWFPPAEVCRGTSAAPRKTAVAEPADHAMSARHAPAVGKTQLNSTGHESKQVLALLAMEVGCATTSPESSPVTNAEINRRLSEDALSLRCSPSASNAGRVILTPECTHAANVEFCRLLQEAMGGSPSGSAHAEAARVASAPEISPETNAEFSRLLRDAMGEATTVEVGRVALPADCSPKTNEDFCRLLLEAVGGSPSASLEPSGLQDALPDMRVEETHMPTQQAHDSPVLAPPATDAKPREMIGASLDQLDLGASVLPWLQTAGEASSVALAEAGTAASAAEREGVMSPLRWQERSAPNSISSSADAQIRRMFSQSVEGSEADDLWLPAPALQDGSAEESVTPQRELAVDDDLLEWTLKDGVTLEPGVAVADDVLEWMVKVGYTETPSATPEGGPGDGKCDELLGWTIEVCPLATEETPGPWPSGSAGADEMATEEVHAPPAAEGAAEVNDQESNVVERPTPKAQLRDFGEVMAERRRRAERLVAAPCIARTS